jgi:hypothetical protein
MFKLAVHGINELYIVRFLLGLAEAVWVEVWRKKIASGDVIVVRYADDLVLGFQYRRDAERFLREFRERLAKFGLELHADKTRLIEFGRFAARLCGRVLKSSPKAHHAYPLS